MFGTAWSAQRSFWSSSTAMMIPLTLQPSRHDSHQVLSARQDDDGVDTFADDGA